MVAPSFEIYQWPAAKGGQRKQQVWQPRREMPPPALPGLGLQLGPPKTLVSQGTDLTLHHLIGKSTKFYSLWVDAHLVRLKLEKPWSRFTVLDGEVKSKLESSESAKERGGREGRRKDQRSHDRGVTMGRTGRKCRGLHNRGDEA